MNITAEAIGMNPRIDILRLSGDLDASSYLDLINFAKQTVEKGAQNLVLDLGEMKFMSSAGLVALHSMVMLLRGEVLPDPEAGWNAIHAISREVEKAQAYEARLKLFNPQPRVSKTLALTGFDKIIQVFPDQQTALESFTV